MTVGMRYLRIKSKFSKPDPFHFRNMLGNFEVTAKSAHDAGNGPKKGKGGKGGVSVMIVEIQIHHRAILEFNNDPAVHVHDHYDCAPPRPHSDFFPPRVLAVRPEVHTHTRRI